MKIIAVLAALTLTLGCSNDRSTPTSLRTADLAGEWNGTFTTDCLSGTGRVHVDQVDNVFTATYCETWLDVDKTILTVKGSVRGTEMTFGVRPGPYICVPAGQGIGVASRNSIAGTFQGGSFRFTR